MNDFLDKLNKASREVRLQLEAKDSGRRKLAAYMSANPLPQRQEFWLMRWRMATAAFCALVILAGGTSLAAAHALPGDLLYNVKVNINEEVQSALKLDAADKAQYQIQRAENRLDEAQQLAGQGKLSATAQTKVVNNFRSQIKQVNANINKLRQTGQEQQAETLAGRLQDALDNRESFWDGQDNTTVSQEVQIAADNAAVARVQLQKKSGQRAAAKQTIEAKLKKAEKAAKSEQKANDVRKLRDQSEQELQKDNYQQAIILGNQAWRQARETRNKNLNGD